MQPWKVSVGLTVAVAGVAAILLIGRLEYLAEFRRVILADYGLVIALYLGLALATLAALFYWAARALGLGDLGRRSAWSSGRSDAARVIASSPRPCSATPKASGSESAKALRPGRGRLWQGLRGAACGYSRFVSGICRHGHWDSMYADLGCSPVTDIK